MHYKKDEEKRNPRDLILKITYGVINLLLIILAGISLMSMGFIQRESQKLATIGIYANRRLFTLYAILWGFSSLFFSAWFIRFCIEIHVRWAHKPHELPNMVLHG